MSTQTLKKIKDFCVKTYAVSHGRRHDLGHIQRVRNNACAMVKILRIVSIDKNLLESACYLHDIVQSQENRGTVLSSLFNHVFEKYLNKKYISGIIEQFSLDPKEKQILITAIVNHPHSLPYRRLNRHNDLYSQILQDADSIDYVSKERQIDFEKAHPKLSFVARIYLFFLRKNIRYFLNFPQLGASALHYPGFMRR